jgi:hypothetical protein
MVTQTTNPLLIQAHHYAETYGWAVIPVTGKDASCKWKRYQRSGPTSKQRGGLFSGTGITGLAVITGEVSNRLRIRDFDRDAAYKAWATAHHDLAVSLPTAKTHRGYHVYFRADCPEGYTKYDDGELRAGKCYVVLPPSPHPDGGTYEWLIPPGATIPFVNDIAREGLLGPAPPKAEPTAVPPAVQRAIEKTLPTAYGQRHNLIFRFARRLKGIDGLEVSARALKGYIREWHRQAEPTIKTKEFDVTDAAFFDAWNNVEVPLSDDAFWSLVKEAMSQPDPAWFEDWFFPEKGQRLLRVCMALQELAGDEPFFLSARMASVAVGVTPNLACELFKKLVTAGYLQVVEKGRLVFEQGKETDKVATTWRYLGPREYDTSEQIEEQEERKCA